MLQVLGFDEIFAQLTSSSVALGAPATKESMPIKHCELGDFDDVWRYLNGFNPKSNNSVAEIDYESDEAESVLSVKQRKQLKKRELRKRNRRLAHEQVESNTVPNESDVPELGGFSTASDPEPDSDSASEDACMKEERLNALRSTLDSVTAAFQPKHLKRQKLDRRDRMISMYKKLATAGLDNVLDTSTDTLQAIQIPDSLAFNDRIAHKSSSKSSTAASRTHIFVDSSNIFLGFQNMLQQRYPLSYPAHSHHKPTMDIHVLDTILERGRSSCVKALVGSSPLLQSWSEATDCGYEVSMLERVAAPNATNKREQGVDELLHLKMMESLLDSDQPGVMLLASGDANVAQFSSGFFNVVLRALGRGWKVEVWAFSRSVNRLWLDRSFRNEYRGEFSLHYLDDYLLELEA